MRLRRALNIETVGVIFWDSEIRIREANDAFLQLTGFTAEEIEGKSWKDFTPEDHHAASEKAVEQMRREGVADPYEKELYRRDGSRWWGLFAARQISEDEAVEFVIDVTARRQAEAALRASEARLREVANAVPGSLFTFNKEGVVQFIGYQHSALTGVDESETSGFQWMDLIHPDDRPTVEASWAASLAALTEWVVRYRVRSQTGDYHWVLLQARPVRDAKGGLSQWVGVVTDVDELVRAQEEVRRLNKGLEDRVAEVTRQVRELSSRLTMAEQVERRRIAGVLHDDLQQILHGVHMQLSFVKDCLGSGKMDQGMKQLQDAEEWLKKSIGITRRLTVELSPPILKREGLADAARWILRQMKELHGMEVELRTQGDIQVKEPHLRVVLYQTIRELLFNVVKHSGTRSALFELEEDAEGLVSVRISDRGKGFDLAEAESKGDQGGSFGLFSARERLKLFGGSLEIVSARGEGTTITARLPNTISKDDNVS